MVLARNWSKNVIAKSRRLSSAITAKPAACSALRYCAGSTTKLDAAVVAHRIAELASTSLHDIVYPKKRARPQHAMDLRTELGFVLDIHADMQHVAAIEGAVGEGHRKRTALMQ